MCPEGKQGSTRAGPVESRNGIWTFPGGNGELPEVLEREHHLDRFLVWHNHCMWGEGAKLEAGSIGRAILSFWLYILG